jgi:outer membrane immunogenic protein
MKCRSKAGMKTGRKTWVAKLVLFGALVAAQSAVAADLSVAPLYKAPPPQLAPPAYNWTGFYVGANGGGGWGGSWWDSQSTSINLSGGQVGGTAGYNWQFGNAVLGVEGDLDWSNLSGTSGSSLCPGCSTSDSWLSTVRGRAGYAFGSVMPYVTGGLAVGDIRATAPGLPGASATNTGWTVGGGIEFALPGNWTAKAEYLHVDLGDLNCGTNCGGLPNDTVSKHDDIVRAGLNYHFGWGK